MGAQEGLIDADPAVVKARADLEAAQAAAHEAEAELEATTEQHDGSRPGSPRTRRRSRRSNSNAPQLAQLRDGLRDHLRQRAVALYSMGGPGIDVTDLFSGTVLDGARRKQLGEAANRSDHDNAVKLEETRTTLATTQATLRREQDDLAQQQTALDGLLADLQEQQAAVEQRVAEANAALERARVIGALHAAGEPVIGPRDTDRRPDGRVVRRAGLPSAAQRRERG